MKNEIFKLTIQIIVYLIVILTSFVRSFEKQIDVDEVTAYKILKKAGANNKMINNLMEGIFTPINFSEPRFKTKVEKFYLFFEYHNNLLSFV